MGTNAVPKKTKKKPKYDGNMKHTFFSFLVRSSVLKGATPRTMAKARPEVDRKIYFLE